MNGRESAKAFSRFVAISIIAFAEIIHSSTTISTFEALIIMPSYTLHAPEASFRAFSTLIAAEYNGVTVTVDTDLKAASKSPVGKLPVLVLPNGEVVFSSQASARYMAGLRRDSGLTGTTLTEGACIDAWMDWASTDLELPACVWFYPVAGYMPFNQAAYVNLLYCCVCVLSTYLRSLSEVEAFFVSSLLLYRRSVSNTI